MEALASATKDHLDFITRIYDKSGFEPFTEKIAAFSS
jgi:SOS-response transcriptional repressor LexA